MPSSPHSSIYGIFKSINEINPQSILDIGVGFGKWGVLIREYFDLRPDPNDDYAAWSILMNGIEIHEKYLTPIHKYVYNKIFIGNAIDILKKNKTHYELILAVDIIEHFTKEAGKEFMKLCLKRADNVIINTPNIYFSQDEVFGNKYEAHLSGWDSDDFICEEIRYLWLTGINLTAVFSKRSLNLPRIDDFKEKKPDISDLQNIFNG